MFPLGRAQRSAIRASTARNCRCKSIGYWSSAVIEGLRAPPAKFLEMLCSRSVRVVLLSLLPCCTAGFAFAQVPVGEVDASMATVKGSIVASPTGVQVMSGSSVTATVSTTSLRLIRGGEIRICRDSSVSLTNSPNSSDLFLGLSKGTIEVHYPLATSLDTIWTPDFRISLTGPGRFHLAVNTDEHGDTCVQTLHGHIGSVTVVQLLGGQVSAVRPGESVLFQGGRVSQRSTRLGNCGCPPFIPVHRAAAEPPPKTVAEPPAAPPPFVAALSASSPEGRNITAPPPADRPDDIHVKVDVPFVFRALAQPPLPDVPASDDVRVRLSDLPVLSMADAQPPADNVAQAAEPQKKKRRGFWAAIGAIFRR